MIEKRKKIVNLVIVIMTTAMYVGWVLIDYFYYHSIPDAPGKKDSNNMTALVFFMLFGAAYLVGYILNLFLFKKVKVYKIMNFFSSGAFIFLASSSIINLVVSDERISFSVDNTDLFITSSFTLLGFGLTVTAILVPYLVKKFKDKAMDKKLESPIFELIVSYSLLFVLGVVFTISSLLNIQYSDTTFYKITISRALFYSGAQMLFIIIELITHFVSFVIEKPDSAEPPTKQEKDN